LNPIVDTRHPVSKILQSLNFHLNRNRLQSPCYFDQFWLLDWYPNQADLNFSSDTVGIFTARLLRQLFSLERFRQNDKFKTVVFEQQPSHRRFHPGILSQLLDNLPKANPGGLFSKTNLQSNAIRRVDDRFNLSVYKSAAVQFYRDVLADFERAHAASV